MELKQLYELILEKESIEKKLDEYNLQKETLENKINELNKILEKELKDVERLENTSFASFIYNVLGNIEEKLEKERKEAFEVKTKINSFKFQLESIYSYINTYENKLNNINNSRDKYEELLNNKKETLKNRLDIVELENKIIASLHQQKEITEAIAVGNTCLKATNNLFEKLREAADWAIRDMLGKGLWSYVAHANKYECLDQSYELSDKLQTCLQQFRVELIDVNIHQSFKVEISDTDKGIDLWFDNFFTDYSVKEKIDNAITNCKQLYKSIELVVNELNEALENEKEKYNILNREFEELIVNA